MQQCRGMVRNPGRNKNALTLAPFRCEISPSVFFSRLGWDVLGADGYRVHSIKPASHKCERPYVRTTDGRATLSRALQDLQARILGKRLFCRGIAYMSRVIPRPVPALSGCHDEAHPGPVTWKRTNTPRPKGKTTGFQVQGSRSFLAPDGVRGRIIIKVDHPSPSHHT